MDNFVARQNIKNFRRELENGIEEPRRGTLLRLLDEHLKDLDLTGEVLRSLDRHIARLTTIVPQQIKLIDNLRLLGEPIEQPQAVLATLNDLLAVYVAHRERGRAS